MCSLRSLLYGWCHAGEDCSPPSAQGLTDADGAQLRALDVLVEDVTARQR